MKGFCIFLIIAFIGLFGYMCWDIGAHHEQRKLAYAEAALPPNAQNFICEKPDWYSFFIGNKKFNMHQTHEKNGYTYQFIEVTE